MKIQNMLCPLDIWIALRIIKRMDWGCSRSAKGFSGSAEAFCFIELVGKSFHSPALRSALVVSTQLGSDDVIRFVWLARAKRMYSDRTRR